MPTTVARSAPGSCRGSGRSSGTSSTGSSGVPASASGAPAASRAATGANTSRPWNVAETGSSRHGEAEISTASAIPPNRSAAGSSSPLSGPTSSRSSSAVRSATARRARADLGIDDREVDAARRERQRPRERQRSLQDPVARDPVGEVDHPRLGRLARDHRVHDADELVGRAVVGEERDRAHRAAEPTPGRGRRRPARRRGRPACAGRPPGRARSRPRAARRSWPGRSRRSAGRRACPPRRGRSAPSRRT